MLNTNCNKEDFMFVKNKILKAIVLGTFSFSAITYAADYPVEVNSLHYAVSINKTSYVESLILEEPNLVAQFNKDGLTPIHVAIDSNSLSSLKVLLENKTNPNIKNAFDETPLVYAIKKNKLAYAKELLKYKANPKIEDSKGFNALYYAKKAGKDFENIFIEKKAAVSNLNSNLNKDTKDTLMAAQQKQLKKFEQKLQLELDKKN
jgi:ankyrin repeat protein